MSLAELEEDLRFLSHDRSPIQIVQTFAKALPSRERQSIFTAPGALVRPPIYLDEVRARGLCLEEDDAFVLLQGDVVTTESAYFLGEQLIGERKFAVANSTCDLMPGRRKNAALFQVQPVLAGEPSAKGILGNLLKFESTQRMFLPPLPGDTTETLGNALIFDGIAQICLGDLLLAKRIASLSLVGWRVFASMVRTVMCRARDSEVELRTKL